MGWIGCGRERTPRYLECQFEERSEPVSVGAGTLLLGGGVGMIGELWFQCLEVVCVWLYVSSVTCEWRVLSFLSPRELKRGLLGPYPYTM